MCVVFGTGMTIAALAPRQNKHEVGAKVIPVVDHVGISPTNDTER